LLDKTEDSVQLVTGVPALRRGKFDAGQQGDAGNVFQGHVLLDGKPVPGAVVEVEYYNEKGAYEAPNDYMVAQVVTADDNGVFTYAVPWAGWWGFAALNTSDAKMDHGGAPKGVELGAVLWTEFLEPVRK